MDRFTVSGESLRKHYNENTTLDMVFSDIEKELRVHKRVVCQFIVNGLELSESEESDYSKMRLKDVQSLEYLAEDSGQLVSGVMKGWVEALPELIQSCDGLSKRLRNSGAINCTAEVQHLIQNLEIFISSLNSLRLLLTNISVERAKKWDTMTDITRKAIIEVSQAIIDKKMSTLADIIDYDLAHALQLWFETLQGEYIEQRDESNQRTDAAFPSDHRRKIFN